MIRYNKMKGAFNAPISVNVSLTDKCNAKCPFCFQPSGTGLELSYQKLERLLYEMADMGVRLVQFSGGEPILYSKLADAVSLATQLGLETRLSTSGIGLTKTMIKTLRNAGLGCCHISLNGSSKEIHEVTRSGYEDAIKALYSLQDEGQKSKVNWVAMCQNAADFPRVIELAHKFGAAGCEVISPKMMPSGTTPPICTSEQLKELSDLCKKEKDFIFVESCFVSLRILVEGRMMGGIDKGCQAGRFFMSVDARGRFNPCPHISMPSCSKSIVEYWEHDAGVIRLRERFMSGKTYCSECLC